LQRFRSRKPHPRHKLRLQQARIRLLGHQQILRPRSRRRLQTFRQGRLQPRGNLPHNNLQRSNRQRSNRQRLDSPER
jgi:hypothetical protein